MGSATSVRATVRAQLVLTSAWPPSRHGSEPVGCRPLSLEPWLRPGWGHLSQKGQVRTKAPTHPPLECQSSQPCSFSEREAGGATPHQGPFPHHAHGVRLKPAQARPVASPAGADSTPPPLCTGSRSQQRAGQGGGTKPRPAAFSFPGLRRAGRCAGARAPERLSAPWTGSPGAGQRGGPAHRLRDSRGFAPGQQLLGPRSQGALGSQLSALLGRLLRPHPSSSLGLKPRPGAC